MDSNTLIFLAILPIYIIGNTIYKKDHQKESTSILRKLFIFGCLSTILVVIISVTISALIPVIPKNNEGLAGIQLLAYCFFKIALVEETSKWLMVFLIAYKSPEFDEVYDGIVYAVFVALGFATIENFLYILGSESMLFTAGFRAITAVPVHAFVAVIMGGYISLAKIEEKRGNNKGKISNLLLSILIPTIIHGLYDYFVMTSYYMLILMIILLIFLYIYCIKKINKVSNENQLI